MSFLKNNKIKDVVKNTTLSTNLYDIVVIKQGNGTWYHGFENPLQHKWKIIDNNMAICYICKQVIEKRYKK